MHKKILTVLMLSSYVALSHAALPPRAPIGMVSSSGSFTVGSTSSTGTATLFEGDRLETAGSSTRVHLSNGVNLEVFAHSGASLFSSHVEVTTGTVSVQLQNDYEINAGSYSIHNSAVDTKVDVQIGSNGIIVGVPSGSAEVNSSSGALLSKMSPGTTLNFGGTATAGAVNQITMLGVLTRSNDHFLVRDRYTNLVNELAGNVPDKDVNKLVSVEGEVISNKSSIANVDHIVQIAKIALSTAAVGAPCLADGVGGIAARIVIEGVISKRQNHFLVTNTDHKTYEVVGNVNDSQVGQKFHGATLVLTRHPAVAPAQKVVYTEARNFAFFASPCAGLATAGSAVTAGLLAVPKNDPPGAKVPISF